jgi:hypothetical protein
LPFWRACRRWFWSFTGLGALIVVLAAIAATLGIALGSLLSAGAAVVAALVLLELVNTLGEYARALGVARGRRNPFALLGMALGFLRRRFFGAVGLALLGFLIHLALAALYGAVARLFGGSPAVVLWQQAAVLGWLWVKLLRLAWAASYVRLEPMEETPTESTAIPSVVS